MKYQAEFTSKGNISVYAGDITAKSMPYIFSVSDNPPEYGYVIMAKQMNRLRFYYSQTRVPVDLHAQLPEILASLTTVYALGFYNIYIKELGKSQPGHSNNVCQWVLSINDSKSYVNVRIPKAENREARSSDVDVQLSELRDKLRNTDWSFLIPTIRTQMAAALPLMRT